MKENLTKARCSAQFLVEDLRRALSKANPVEALVLLPMIGEAAKAHQQIVALLFAVCGND